MAAVAWPRRWQVLAPPAPTAVLPSAIEPGDLLLFMPDAADAMQKLIQAAQARVYARPHYLFTHVAMYADHGLVVDATPSHGLVSRAWSGAFAGAHTRVRRLRGVTSLQQDEMATLARSLNGNYSYLSAAASAVLARLRTPNNAQWTLVDRRQPALLHRHSGGVLGEHSGVCRCRRDVVAAFLHPRGWCCACSDFSRSRATWV